MRQGGDHISGYYEVKRGQVMKCDSCGKDFYCWNQSDWAYRRNSKNGSHFFCSWSCMRRHDREAEAGTRRYQTVK